VSLSLSLFPKTEEEGERRNLTAEEGEKEQLQMTCSIDSGVVG
jgi:hypothetical protein